MANYDKEIKETIEWLEHPNELGKKPSKIEFVKEFHDEGERCIIFRFKEKLFSPWCMAIYSDALGVYSECEKYDKNNDIEQATKMLEYLKQYWKNVALNAEERKERNEKAEPFQAFVLKEKPIFEPSVFLKMYEQDWGEKLQGEEDTNPEESAESVIYRTESGLTLVIAYMDLAIPNGEAEENAKYNHTWHEGPSIVAKHTAHDIVVVSGGESITERAMFYSKVISTLCKMENHIGVYANGTVYEPKHIVKMCEAVKDGELPLPALVWCIMLRDENNTYTVCTSGMKHFGFDEMEMVKINQNPSNLLELMYQLVSYCIYNDIGFHDGETVGLSAGVQLKVEKSKAYQFDVNKETLKISFL